jgi:hypothetical protein
MLPPGQYARRGRWRGLRRVVGGLMAALVIVGLPPAVFIGVNCYPGGNTSASRTGPPPADIAGYERAEAFTYLTLPEWFIVYSTEEYARFAQRGSPTDFPYLGSISQYWGFYSSVCAVTRSAYPFESGYHVMLGVIGASFTTEYLIKGVYENTVGRVTGWFGRDTPEDAFAAKTAAEYGAFMHTVPWYEFAFGTHLRRLWSDVPLFGPRPVRKWERRLSLTTEYAVKGVYGWVIGLATRSAYSTEDLKIYARVENAPEAIFQDPQVEKVRQTGDGAYIIRLPRYEAFTRTALALFESRLRFLDVAGNDEMLMTVLVPASFDERAFHGGRVVASRPILTDRQHKRLALRVPVVRLHEIVPSLRSAGAIIEHLYDY